ncbi:nucleotide-binding protein, partial [Candidatus Micrarchaeota archaeon]|nr:nucleotide-binding protein [Candidatus Micrarchaeota archaeon]
IDTNFLLIPFQFKIDIFSELHYLIETNFTPVIPSGVVDELKKLSKGKGKEGMAARFALKVLEVYSKNNKLKILKSEGLVDDWILEKVKSKGDFIVCTNDTPLRTKLKRARVPVITMKSRSKVGFI